MIGQVISHFRVLEKLGEGGMGIVYKAEDTLLKRVVAIKVLPRGLEAHEAERARFLQEAQAASAINHPNVCTIHEISTSGDQQFIVMEYVDGKTLREKIAAGRMQIADCVGYAIQIGEALQEAHSKGIVHRDIKAENIMVNSKNQVKVMDFGLAKLKGSLKLTKTSSTVGTLAYMAPEQIQGGEVDARSDIFSFGVVLFEMLTGHLPFRGEHDAAMMYSIVNEEPESLQKYLPDAPVDLLHVLNRALEKDPEDRYQSVHDLVIEIRRLKKQTSRVLRVPLALQTTGGPAERPERIQEAQPRGLKRRFAMIAAAAIVVAGAAIVLLFSSGRPELNPDMKFQKIQLPFRNINYAEVSRDGNWLVFPAADESGKFDVYIVNVSQGQPRRVTFDSSVTIQGVSMSPDASTILYVRRQVAGQRLEVVSVPSLGGKGKVVVERAIAADWQWSGNRISYLIRSDAGSARVTNELWTARPDGSDQKLEYSDTLDQRAGNRVAWNWSPDGKSIAWTRNFPQGYTEIIVRDLETGKERQLTFDKKTADDARWLTNGHIVFSSNRSGNVNLWIVPSSGGEPVQLTRGSGPDVPVWISSDCKRMIYSEIENLGHINLGNLQDGSVNQLTVDERFRSNVSLSPSGKFLTFVAKEENEYSVRTDIYLMDRTGTDLRKLTDGPEIKDFPFWSLDEKWITYSAYLPTEPSDSARVFLVQVENPGKPRMIGKGLTGWWINEKEYVLWNFGRSSRGSLDRPELVTSPEDSLWAAPIIGDRYVALYDVRIGRRGLWITTAQSFASSGRDQAELVVRGNTLVPSFARRGTNFFYIEPGGARDLHRVSLPDGKDQRVGHKFPGLKASFSVRQDGNEIAYVDSYRKTRFVVIEDLFK